MAKVLARYDGGGGGFIETALSGGEDGGHGATTLPVRKRLDHRGPLSIDVACAWYFITICAEERVNYGRAVSMKPPRTPFIELASAILDAARFRHMNGKWFLALFLIMPDHIHLIAHFPNVVAVSSKPPCRGGMEYVIADFKRWLSTEFGLRFQRDFWDTRLRDDAHYAEKFRYICNNPVRKGLCVLARDWPYVIAFDRVTGVERRHRGAVSCQSPAVSSTPPYRDEGWAASMMPPKDDELSLHSLILDYLEKFESASREKIDELLIDEIRGQFSREEKLKKISNILSYLRINKKIMNIGTKHDPNWVLFTLRESQDRIQEKTQIGL